MAGGNKDDYSKSSKALQGLPPKFVSAMRTLFDVMDDKKTGKLSNNNIPISPILSRIFKIQ